MLFNSQIIFAADIGTVLIVRGEAELRHNEKVNKINIGTVISEGDQVETKDKAYIKIVMKDRNVLVVIAKTKIVIKKYSDIVDNKQVEMIVEFGSVRHALQQKYINKNEKYEVRTPTTVAGVRGTDFITEYNNDTGESVLCALEGKVSLDVLKNGIPEQNPVILVAGHFVKFKKTDTRPQVVETKKPWLEKVLKSHSLE